MPPEPATGSTLPSGVALFQNQVVTSGTTNGDVARQIVCEPSEGRPCQDRQFAGTSYVPLFFGGGSCLDGELDELHTLLN
jgi:hypothetical protein